MIVDLRSPASEVDVASVRELATRHGLDAHVVPFGGRTVVVVLGTGDDDPTAFERLPGVVRVVASPHPFQLAARAYRPGGAVVSVDGIAVGDGGFTVIAGPCAVESEHQLAVTADLVRAAGAPMLRGGAVKPRTSPYSFAGLGRTGLELLAEQRRRTGLRVVTEVLSPADVEITGAHADVLQIGTRNAQNFPLLREVGRSGRPVLLKRGMGATIEEWLLAAEHVLAAGNPDVILCERGIRTFEPATRFTLDIAAVPILKRLTSLPVFVDPSHATGHADIVPAMALAAAAAGADGLLVDVHPNRLLARCDGGQAITPDQFRVLMGDLATQLRAAGRAPVGQKLPQIVG